MKNIYTRSLKYCMKLWLFWNVSVFLFNILCCFPQIQHAKPTKIQESVCNLTGSCRKNVSYKRVSIHLCSMKKSSGGSAQTCGLNFFRTISTLIIFSNEQFLDFYFRQASFLWRVRENDKGVTRNNSIIECPNENACRHEEECCAFDSLPIFNFPMDI